jgi:hypothetical protein
LVISARRDWRWWLLWRMWLLAAGLACTGVVAARSAYWWAYAQGSGSIPVVPGLVAGGPVMGPSGEVRLEVEVVDGAGGVTRTEQVVISTAPEPGVAGLIGVGMVLVMLRRRRGLRG